MTAASLVALGLPVAAGAEYYVPPGNSAATQYTEAYPTAGGQKNAEGGTGGGGRSPAQVLGERNARRLESQGAAGRAAAALAAESAPERSAGDSNRRGPGAASGGRGGRANAAGGGEDGGSGLGEVIGQATGTSSSEGTGLLLPLAIVGTIVWSLAYAVRRRQRPAE